MSCKCLHTLFLKVVLLTDLSYARVYIILHLHQLGIQQPNLPSGPDENLRNSKWHNHRDESHILRPIGTSHTKRIVSFAKQKKPWDSSQSRAWQRGSLWWVYQWHSPPSFKGSSITPRPAMTVLLRAKMTKSQIMSTSSFKPRYISFLRFQRFWAMWFWRNTSIWKRRLIWKLWFKLLASSGWVCDWYCDYAVGARSYPCMDVYGVGGGYVFCSGWVLGVVQEV